MSNGSARNRVVLVVLDGWGYRHEREGNAIELASTPVWHRLWESLPADAAGRERPGRRPARRADGQQRGGAPQPRRRPGGAAGPGADLPEHPERRVLPAPAAGRAVHARSGRPAAPCTSSACSGPAACTRSTATCWPASSWASGTGCRPSPSTASSTAATPRPPWAPRWSARCCSTCGGSPGQRVDIASLTGRYFGMDRDRRWDRTRLAYDAMVHGVGTPVEHPVLAVQAAYQRGETDEFIRPLVHHRNGRPGRHRCATATASCSSTTAATACARSWPRSRWTTSTGSTVGDRPALSCVTMTQYDQTFPLPQAFPPFSLARILAEVLADHGRTQFRTAETEKYPHVTYFFNGGYEPPYPGEERCLIPSQRVATYDLAPEMSAAGITDALCRTIEGGAPRLHPLQLRQRGHGGAHRRAAGGRQGGGDGGPRVSSACWRVRSGPAPASSSPPTTATAR